MIYGSVCSGIEAATVAWKPLGWKAAWFSEIEPFPSAVLEHHYPEIPNLGDMTRIQNHERFKRTTIDLLVGGTPCQSFSVAGLRKGMEDPRGNLALVYLSIADRARPPWVVWENVPGVLSSNEGRDFGAFLGALAELGYGWAYRVLNAQYFGVPQRRRRVFVVGYLGDWRRAASVLFERESLSRYSPPSREEGERIAPCLETSSHDTRDEVRDLKDRAGALNANEGMKQKTYLAIPIHDKATRHKGGGESRQNDGAGNGLGIGKDGDVCPTITSGDKHAVAFHASQDPDISVEVAHPIGAQSNGMSNGVAIPIDLRNATRDPEKKDEINRQGVGVGEDGEPAHTLSTACVHGVAQGMTVRRLTPKECERLQGFPDNYTRISRNGKKASACPDGPRYKALGNSMAVPVMEWIGERIQEVKRNIEEGEL